MSPESTPPLRRVRNLTALHEVLTTSIFTNQPRTLLAAPDKANQDDFCIKSRFGGYEDRAMFAVFDGHGTYGDHCANFCADTVSQRD